MGVSMYFLFALSLLNLQIDGSICQEIAEEVISFDSRLKSLCFRMTFEIVIILQNYSGMLFLRLAYTEGSAKLYT